MAPDLCLGHLSANLEHPSNIDPNNVAQSRCYVCVTPFVDSNADRNNHNYDNTSSKTDYTTALYTHIFGRDLGPVANLHVPILRRAVGQQMQGKQDFENQQQIGTSVTQNSVRTNGGWPCRHYFVIYPRPVDHSSEYHSAAAADDGQDSAPTVAQAAPT